MYRIKMHLPKVIKNVPFTRIYFSVLQKILISLNCDILVSYKKEKHPTYIVSIQYIKFSIIILPVV